MKQLHFTYEMQIDYAAPISKCHFTIKCIPRNTLRQTIENICISFFPDTEYQWGTDGFRNFQIWGSVTESHSVFRFRIEGDVLAGEEGPEEKENDETDMIFAHPNGLNVPGETIRRFWEENIKGQAGGSYEKVCEITRILHEEYRYVSGSTGIYTTAEEAMAQGQGVCQDYAHILIALLHLSRIPARYVTGFIIGEGLSHAWVEFLADGKWYGIDPTNNKPVNDEYIKIGHGRHALDCRINRGTVYGSGEQTQRVRVNVEER